ncbi:unnamed protein product [Ectocarpus sp. 12 AP-2014]
MMATITNNADNESNAGVAPTAAPAPAPAPTSTSPGHPNTTEGSTWPGALRIDVELAENHARRTTGADGGSKRHCGSGRVAIPTRPPTAKNGVHRVTNRVDFADDDRRGDCDDDNARKEAGEAGAGLEVDAEIAESHHACRVEPVRHRSGITTRSVSQRRKQQQQRQPQQRSILQKGGALVSTGKSCGGEALNGTFDDEVSSPPGETPAGGDSGNNKNNNDGDGGGAAAAGKGQADKLQVCHWYEREEKAEEGGDAGDAAAAAAAFSSGKIELKADLVTHERVGVQEEGGEHNKVEDDGVQAQGGPPSSLESRQPPSHAKGVSGGGEHPRHPSSMDRLGRLVSRAMATIAKAETTTSAASEGVGLDLRCGGNAAAAAAVTWPTSQPEAPYPDQNDPAAAAAAAAAHSGIIGHPAQQQQGEQEIRLTFRKAHSDYIHLREKSRYIDVRCSATIRTLQSVSQAVRTPGRGLHQSYDAYLRAYYFFRAVERSVRAADVQEDAARRELRRASQAARSALRKQTRAEAVLRAFDTTGGGSSSSSSSCSSSVNGVSEEMLPPPPPPPPSEDSVLKERRAGTAGRERGEHEQNEAERAMMPCTTRASLELALGIARLEARRAFAEKHRAQAVADDALILVGALTAGDWSLAGEQYDAARTAFHDASRDALSKIQEFEDQTLLFKKLMQGRVEIRRQLVLACEARDAAELAAEAMRTGLAAATAAAVETAMVRPAAESSGGGSSSSGGGGRVENGERGGGSALFFVPPDDDQEGWDEGLETRRWPRKPVASRLVEDQSGEEGDAGRAVGGATAGDDTDDGNEVPAKKKAKI